MMFCHAITTACLAFAFLITRFRFLVTVSSKGTTTGYTYNRQYILGDPGADSGDVGKSKRAEKCGAKKSKERQEEPLGTMSYQTSSKWSPIRSQNGSDRLLFFVPYIFFRPFRLSLAPFICPWVSEDGVNITIRNMSMSCK